MENAANVKKDTRRSVAKSSISLAIAYLKFCRLFWLKVHSPLLLLFYYIWFSGFVKKENQIGSKQKEPLKIHAAALS
jgi:hypothetical protein